MSKSNHEEQRTESPEEAHGRARELARRQGVEPIRGIEDLRGDFWPEEDNADEFLSWVRTLRQDDARRSIPE
ncbi:MAG TPA: hypothetical protein VGB76_00650 [Pyrinomonadaceae bacterium]|jgi:hypothetical protein